MVKQDLYDRMDEALSRTGVAQSVGERVMPRTPTGDLTIEVRKSYYDAIDLANDLAAELKARLGQTPPVYLTSSGTGWHHISVSGVDRHTLMGAALSAGLSLKG